MKKSDSKTQTARALIAKRKQEIAARPVADRPQYEVTLDQVAAGSWAQGREIKFDHEKGVFVTRDDGREVDPDLEFIALMPETVVGLVKFNGAGISPERYAGKLYENFVLPDHNSLGDLDETKWRVTPWGQPEDPWQVEIAVALQSVATSEIFAYIASNETGRYPARKLCSHYNFANKNAGTLPVINLRAGRHKGKPVPVFVVCGRQPDPNAKPAAPAVEVPTSVVLDDDIPAFE